jgi:transcriptional regulator with XRE-family HTH domain
MTQAELARAAGVSETTVRRIEAGIVTPRLDTFQQLLAAAGRELVVEARLGLGVDRTLIRDRLRMTPAERIRLAVQEARAFLAISSVLRG